MSDQLDDVDDGLFAVVDVPAPSTTSGGPAGSNLTKLDRALRARGVEVVDEALAEQARSAALALDLALRGKNPAYAVAALMKPYLEVLCALGLGGLAAGTPAPGGDDPAARILEAFAGGPTPVPDPG